MKDTLLLSARGTYNKEFHLSMTSKEDLHDFIFILGVNTQLKDASLLHAQKVLWIKNFMTARSLKRIFKMLFVFCGLRSKQKLPSWYARVMLLLMDFIAEQLRKGIFENLPFFRGLRPNWKMVRCYMG